MGQGDIRPGFEPVTDQLAELGQVRLNFIVSDGCGVEHVAEFGMRMFP